MSNNLEVLYFFDGFTLSEENSLSFGGERVNIPPKELSLLSLFVSSSEKLISKEKIINDIWVGGVVSDESLTRCIYSLRKRLRTYKNMPFIETVYGKGYRFVSPVSRVNHGEVTGPRRTLAVFPFQLGNIIDSALYHNSIIEGIANYKFSGVDVFSSAISKNCLNIKAIDAFISRFNPDYYLTGQIMTVDDGFKIFIELACGVNHFTTSKTSIVFNSTDSIAMLLPEIIAFIIQSIQNLEYNGGRGAFFSETGTSNRNDDRELSCRVAPVTFAQRV